MIPLLLFGTRAAAADRWVDSTANTDTAGTLRYHLNRAGPGDRIRFSTAAFPAGQVTPILVGATLPTQALPNLDEAGVILDGAGRVAITCATTLTSGSGLTVTADDVHVLGLEISGCPDHGVDVRGDRVIVGSVAPNEVPLFVHDNRKLGIQVAGLSTDTADVIVRGNVVTHNCTNPTLSCAGIGIKKQGTGTGPIRALIVNNVVDDTASLGHGIGVFGGTEHRIEANTIGLTAGNAGSGVAVVAPTGGYAQVDALRDNLVVNNGQSGILLGANSDHCWVEDNLVGTDGEVDLGNAGAGISVFASDHHTLLRNVVSGNALQGISVNGTAPNGSPAEFMVIEENLVGLTADGLDPLGNDQVGIDLSGVSGVVTGHVLRDNFVSANGSHGVRIAARGVLLEGNWIGLDADPRQLVQGNAGAGIRVTNGGRAARIERWNVIGGNGGDGIESWANELVVDHAVIGTTLANGNDPGAWPDPGSIGIGARPYDRGNDGAGVRIHEGANGRITHSTVVRSGDDGLKLDADAGGTGISGWVLESNTVSHHAGSGLSASGPLTDTSWIANSIHDNGACPYDVAATVNGGLQPATVIEQSGHRVAGNHLGTRVDVYVGVAGEAERWLGEAVVNGVDWSLDLSDTDPAIPAGARVIAITTSGARSAAPLGWYGEGCANTTTSTRCFDGSNCTSDVCSSGACSYPANAAANGAVCVDGDDCTTASVCQAGSCVGTTFAAEGAACVDDNACTEATTCNAQHECRGPDDHVCDDGDPCTVESTTCDPVAGCPIVRPRPIGYKCEDGDLCTGTGTCDALGDCVVPGNDPAVTCPQDTLCNVCECSPNKGCECHGVCDDGKCGPDDFTADDGEPCAECFDLNGRFDDDEDGIPNIWDGPTKNIDLDCDGTYEYGPAGLEENPTDPNVKDVFLEIDWMAPADGHEHFPYQTDELERVFSEHGMALHVQVSDEVPHADELVTSPKRTPLTAPDESTWVSLREIKRQYFDARDRRGLYHYQLIGHHLDHPGTREFGGLGESLGDDTVLGKATVDAIDDPLATMLHELGGVDPVPWTASNPQERMSPCRVRRIPRSSGLTSSLS